MSFQEKLFETTADLRTRAAALASVAVSTARARAEVAVHVLTVAGRELNKVARRHVVRFVKENSTIATDARKDVAFIARSTYSSLAAKRGTAKPKTRKSSSVRKRAKAKAA